MTEKIMTHGPFKGEMVETYDGNNPHKQNTVFAHRIGVRLDAHTGEIVNGGTLQGIAATPAATPMLIPEAEVAMLEARLADAKQRAARVADKPVAVHDDDDDDRDTKDSSGGTATTSVPMSTTSVRTETNRTGEDNKPATDASKK